ncbi:MAG: nitroreductase family protein [Opitutaceae bacterium]
MQQNVIEKKEARLFARLVLERRATPHFRPDPVPEETIETALGLAAQAPSGYNFQPWRFLVLTEPEQRARLQRAALNQEKIAEAPLVIVAFGERQGWKSNVDEILRIAAEHRGLPADTVEKQKSSALAFVEKLDPAVWLNRQVMIGFTHLMLSFEALGWDTAPMEGFDPAAVKSAFALPADAEVVALLAVGRARDAHLPHPGRLAVDRIAYSERYGEPFAPAAALVATD